MTKQLPLPFAAPARQAIAMQTRCTGDLETTVFGVTANATRGGEPAHVGIKFGRILIYLEDRAALESLVRITRQAEEMAAAIFRPAEDAFTQAEADARRRFERTGDVAKLR